MVSTKQFIHPATCTAYVACKELLHTYRPVTLYSLICEQVLLVTSEKKPEVSFLRGILYFECFVEA